MGTPAAASTAVAPTTPAGAKAALSDGAEADSPYPAQYDNLAVAEQRVAEVEVVATVKLRSVSRVDANTIKLTKEDLTIEEVPPATALNTADAQVSVNMGESDEDRQLEAEALAARVRLTSFRIAKKAAKKAAEGPLWLRSIRFFRNLLTHDGLMGFTVPCLVAQFSTVITCFAFLIHPQTATTLANFTVQFVIWWSVAVALVGLMADELEQGAGYVHKPGLTLGQRIQYWSYMVFGIAMGIIALAIASSQSNNPTEGRPGQAAWPSGTPPVSALQGWERAYSAVSLAGDSALAWIYYVSQFVGLAQAGLLAGFVVNFTLVTFGFMFCCFGDVFGTFRITRHLISSSRSRQPFIDLVSNRSRSGYLNALILLMPFCISSTLVVSNTLLVPAERIFRTRLYPVARLEPLCTPPFTHALFEGYAAGLRMAGLAVGRNDGRDGTALSLLTFHHLWEAVYHMPDQTCQAAVFTTRISQGQPIASLPPVALAFRDVNEEQATCGPRGCRVAATLVSQPAGCSAAALSGVLLGENSRNLTQGNERHRGLPGLVTFEDLTLATDGAALCAGEYRLNFTLLEGERLRGPPRMFGRDDDKPIHVEIAMNLVLVDESRSTNMTVVVPIPEAADYLTGEVTSGELTFTRTGNLTEVVTITTTNIIVRDNITNEVLNTTFSEERRVRQPSHQLLYVGRMPTALTHLTYTNVTLLLATETGLPVPGEPVQAVLLAPVSSSLMLDAYGATGFTDSDGLVTLSLRLENSASGSGTLVFGSPTTARLDTGLTNAFGPEVDGVRAASTVWNQLFASALPQDFQLNPDQLQVQLQTAMQTQIQGQVGEQLQGQLAQAQTCAEQANQLRSLNETLNATLFSGLSGLALAQAQADLARAQAEAQGLVDTASGEANAGAQDAAAQAAAAAAQAQANGANAAANEQLLNNLLANGSPLAAGSLAAGLTGGLGGIATNTATNLGRSATSAYSGPATSALQQALAQASPAACYNGLVAAGSLTNIQNNPQLQALAQQAPSIASAVLRDIADSYGLSPIVASIEALTPQISSAVQQFNETGSDTIGRFQQLGGRASVVFETAQAGRVGEAMRQLLLLVMMVGAPPPITITQASVVGSVELTAPLSGFGVLPSGGVGPTLWEPREWYQRRHRRACIGTKRDGDHLVFLPPQHVEDGLPSFSLVSPLWQAPLFMKFNWLFDVAPAWLWRGPARAGVPTHDEAYDSICARSFVGASVTLPGTIAVDTQYEYGREASADGWSSSRGFDESARLLESLNGSASLYNAVCRGTGSADASSGSFDAGSGAGTVEAGSGPSLPFCALGDAFTTGWEFADGSGTDEMPLYLRAQPRLIVRDAQGDPIAGKSCMIVDGADLTGRGLGIGEIEKLRIDYECGPSDENGEIELVDVKISGGSTRELNLTISIDGVVAKLSNRSAYKMGTLHYVTSDQLDFRYRDMLFLQGHDSLLVLAVLVMPIFAMNAVGVTGERQPTFWYLAGSVCVLYFSYICLSLIFRQLDATSTGPMSDNGQLSLIGMADLVHVRYDGRATIGGALLWITFIISMTILAWTTFAILRMSWMPLTSFVRRLVIRILERRGIKDDTSTVKSLRRDSWLQRKQQVQDKKSARKKMNWAGTKMMLSDKQRKMVGGVLFGFEEDRSWLWDSANRRRSRRARNHVRMLLLPRRDLTKLLAERLLARITKARRKWSWLTQRVPALERLLIPRSVDGSQPARSKEIIRLLDDDGSFFYPQRLWMAFMLGAWVQMLISATVYNCCDWFLTIFNYGEQLAVQLRADAQYSMDVRSVARFSTNFRFGALLPWEMLGEHLRHPDALLVYENILPPILLVVVPTVQILFFVINWHFIFSSYRQRALNMRRSDYFFARSIYREEHCVRFIGFQIAGSTVNGIMINLFGLVVLLPIGIAIAVFVATMNNNPDFKQSVNTQVSVALPGTLTVVAQLCGTVFFQIYCNRVVFYEGAKGNKWLRHRSMYAFYDYALMFFNISLGIAVVVARMITWLFVGILAIGRIDVQVLPTPAPALALLDVGHTTYIALIQQDHRYNAPVAKAFYQILLVSLHDSRRVQALFKLRSNLKMVLMIERGRKAAAAAAAADGSVSNIKRESKAVADDEASDQPVQRSLTAKEHVRGVLEMVKSRLSECETVRESHFFLFLKQRRLRKRRVAGRWYLAFMLLKNPQLMAERRHAEVVSEVAQAERKAKQISSAVGATSTTIRVAD